MFTTLNELIFQYETECPEKPAISFRAEVLTYRELADQIRRIAGYLRAAGVTDGARVLYSSAVKPSAVAIYLGIQYAGAIAVHVDKNATAEEVSVLARETEASLYIAGKKIQPEPDGCRMLLMKDVLKEAAESEVPGYVKPDPEHIAELIFTSGTTGNPKGVALSYRAVSSIFQHTREGIGITSDDVVLIPLPLHHSFGLRVLRAVLSAGGTVVMQNGFAFAKETESNLLRWHCTGLAAVPASMELMRTQMGNRYYEILSRFRYIEIGAGALTLEQRKRLSANLPKTRLCNTWGSSETGGAIFTDVHAVAKNPDTVTTIGKPLSDITVRVVQDGHDVQGCGPDHCGRMMLTGDMVMSGYWKNPDLTEEALKDGWLLTGDMVYRDEDGYYYMLGRADDLINIGGEKVSPLEIENAASEFPAIRECACIGVAEEEHGYGQVPVLFLSVREEYREEDLIAFLGSKIERHKLPWHYVTVDALPRNKMQKIDRRAIRQLWSELQHKH